MQRIRETSQGLQLTEGLDIVTFSDHGTGVHISRKGSELQDQHLAQHIIIDGRDNIADFGLWMSMREDDPEEDLEISAFTEYTASPFVLAACVSVEPLVFTDENDPEGTKRELTRLVEVAEVLSKVLFELLGDNVEPKHELDVQAFATPFGFPPHHKPLLLAKLTYDQLILSRELYSHQNIPTSRAVELGRWVTGARELVKKKSIFG